MEVPLTVGSDFEKGTICRTPKRLKFVYGCYIPAGFLPVRLALSPGCGALPLPLSSNVAGRLPPACSNLPLSLSPNPAGRMPSAGAPQTLTYSVLLFLALGVSPRPGSGSVCSKLAGSVCSKLGVVLLQLCTFRKGCGRCSQEAGVRVESTKHIMRVHVTQSGVSLAWLAQWGCCLPHSVYSVLCMDPYFFGVVVFYSACGSLMFWRRLVTRFTRLSILFCV